MKRKERIEQEIQKTLDQLGKDDGLQPDPYFYTRLSARLRERTRQPKSWNLILKPAALALLILINIGTIFWYTSSSSGQSTVVDSKTEMVSLLSNDFGVRTSTMDLINLK